MSVLVVEVVAVEVFGVSIPPFAGLFTGVRILAFISVVGVIVSVDGAVEVLGTVEPWAGADEDSAGEPLGTIVTVGGAVIGRSSVVTIGAGWGNAYFHTDLGW